VGARERIADDEVKGVIERWQRGYGKPI